MSDTSIGLNVLATQNTQAIEATRQQVETLKKSVEGSAAAVKGQTEATRQSNATQREAAAIVRELSQQQQASVDRAKLAAATVNALGGAYKITSTQAEEFSAKIREGIKALEDMGQTAPASLNKIQRELDEVAKSASRASASMGAGGGATGGGGGSGAGFLGALVAIGVTAGTAAVAISRLSGFIGESVNAALEADAAERKLAQAVEQSGHAADGTYDYYVSLSDSYALLTRYTDEQIKETEKFLVQIGQVQPAQMKNAIQATTDLAAVTGSLESATTLVAKAAEGNTTALKKMGIEVDAAAVAGGDLTSLWDAIEEHVGGAAQADLNTYSGQLAQVSKEYGELKENIGKFILGIGQQEGAVGVAVSTLTRLAGAAGKLVEIQKELGTFEALKHLDFFALVSQGAFGTGIFDTTADPRGLKGTRKEDIQLHAESETDTYKYTADQLRRNAQLEHELAQQERERKAAAREILNEQKKQTAELERQRDVYSDILFKLSYQGAAYAPGIKDALGIDKGLSQQLYDSTNYSAFNIPAFNDPYQARLFGFGLPSVKAGKSAKAPTAAEARAANPFTSPQFYASMAQILGSGGGAQSIGSGLGGLAGGALGSYAASAAGLTAAGGASAAGAAVGSVLPVVGTIAGAAIGAWIGSKFGNPKKKENAAATTDVQKLIDQTVNQYGNYDKNLGVSRLKSLSDLTGVDIIGEFGNKGVEGLKKLTEAIGEFEQKQKVLFDAVDQFNISFEEMGGALQKLKTEDAGNELLQQLNALKTAGVDSNVILQHAADQVNKVIEMALVSGQKLPEALAPFLDQFRELGLLSEHNLALMQGLSEGTEVDFKKMQSAAEKYGIDLNSLGGKFQQAKVTDTAKTIFDDFQLLTKGGADVGGVLFGMRDEISRLVSDSRKFGTEIPANMRPLVEELARSGNLFDDNRLHLIDLAGELGKLGNVDGLGPLLQQLKDGQGVILDSDGKAKNLVDTFSQFADKVPAELKPTFDAFLKTAGEVDKTGGALKDIKDLSFAETLSAGVEKIVDAINNLTKTLGGDVPSASADSEKAVKGVGDAAESAGNRGKTAGEDLVNALKNIKSAAEDASYAVDAISLGHSPGGLKEIPIKAAEAETAVKSFAATAVPAFASVEDLVNAYGHGIADANDEFAGMIQNLVFSYEDLTSTPLQRSLNAIERELNNQLASLASYANDPRYNEAVALAQSIADIKGRDTVVAARNAEAQASKASAGHGRGAGGVTVNLQAIDAMSFRRWLRSDGGQELITLLRQDTKFRSDVQRALDGAQ